MRLTKIKLAGFKSFVDPTSVQFPSSLVGVVGPNGCGKSNIIDAVRWVLGEISAKHLRGDSMADVVFNGSGSRKPVGAASVELVFDNSDGTLGGEYASYAEVALKRVVSRDGTSAYFLNGVRCRRKDITQLFLGTGLGSRSYAIIEQNMISRIIEGRPEEMRAFLEEAAGISRYKERRRETENRIAHTRENLERLGDLREEVDKQLRHLQRQAATARRYQALKQEERQLGAELLSLRLREVESEAASRHAVLAERDLELQSALAEQRGLEAGIERLRQQHAAATDALGAVQGRYYQVGAEISRSEQAIEHAREMRERQQQELAQASSGHEDASVHRRRDAERAAAMQQELAALEPQLEAARAAEHAAAAELSGAEEAMQAWQSRWEDFNRALGAATSAAGAERARIEQFDHQLRRLAVQRERAGQEHTGLAAADVAGRLAELESAEAQARGALEGARAGLAELVAGLQSERQRERELRNSVEGHQRATREVQGRIVSLEALQRAALGQGQGRVVEWLQARGLGANPRLAQQLSVEPGWEKAIETALGSYLEAVCVESIDDVAGVLDSLGAGTVTFFAGREVAAGADSPAPGLRSRVRGPAGLEPLFDGIYGAESLGEALALRSRLRGRESVITRDGIWMGADWLRVSRDRDAHEGVLEREQELRAQRSALAASEDRERDAESQLEAARARVHSLEDRIADQQAAVAAAGAEHLGLRSQLDGLRDRSEQRARRLEQLALELADFARELEATTAESRTARGRLEEAVEAMASLEQQRRELETERDALRQALGAARGAAERGRSAAREAAILVESRRTGHRSLLEGLQRLDAQLAQFDARRRDLEQQLASGAQAVDQLRAGLEAALARRVEAEEELAAARRALEAVDAELRDLDERRAAAEMRVNDARDLLESVRLSAQELKVRRESLLEQFAATRLELGQVVAGLGAEASVTDWERRLAETFERIERLGQVNLAAIEEFEQQSQRKEYLDRQFNDLTDALATLEEAMRKIDRETRSRFQDTLDRVNAGLKEKFPRLFGGGHAYLEIVGEDVLNAGVAVMARPPGKRNSSISQLSGGEKALTAVAFVFSIFDLNPAPFCLLDEVDAPLDDANVGRFCDIVREMSNRVQFVFVTHNKATMELANQLLGVTMNEPGVSRIVAVDVDEAMRLAAV